ncbi:Os08g0494200 [Oryza sativa Japonica Group]|uniref:Os08g0494200 protein n=2 Tax=Oryza sativa subsp. japonica TaxID=39947 RepID=A0A0P0XH66_ORYSJ|nr:hypothetical protein EE612_045093 [Oryza sativa]BAD10103.1 unknown protein [Oryza sativa Japonica Group]BAF24041.1 Os08g0494200 [Oryza sativa Japonica Group]BAT06047.1 Os08g0494200 [Oryza sativa Japonica Group]|eukprot:NP_001062127.1 Os08g0494200 [Oryza sativa Japonica Group]
MPSEKRAAVAGCFLVGIEGVMQGLLISIYDDDVYSKHGFLAQELFTLPPGVTIMQARLRKALEWKTKRTAL